MDDRPIRKAAKIASEAVVLAMAGLSPWAFGSVDAWAELALLSGVVILAILNLFANHGPGSARRWVCSPSLAMGGLGLLALMQAVPLPISVVKVLAPAVQSLRGGLAPNHPQVVVGDPGNPVAAPLTTLSLEPEASLHAAAALGGAWILFQAVLGLSGGLASYRRFGLAMVGNTVVLSLFSIAQALMWEGKIYGIRRTEIGQRWYTGGPFVCHNHLAACLNLGLGFALGLLAAKSRGNGNRRGQRLVPAFAASLIAVGVLATHSRGGFLAMAASAVATLVALRGGAWRGLAAMAAMSAIFLFAIGSESAVDRVGTILDSGTSGFNGRLEVWGVAVRTWWSHPLVGTGLGCFVPATVPMFERDRGVYFSHAENEPLQMLVEGGVIGLAFALAGLAGTARFGLKALLAAPSGRDRAMIIGGLAGGLALSVQSLGDFALRIPGVSVAAVVLAAHLCRLGLHEGIGAEAPRQPHSGRSRIANGLLAALMVLLSLILCRHGFQRAKAEASILSAGLPSPGAIMPDFGRGPVSVADLQRMRLGLEGALRSRPDWCEGHLRLGITLMALYEMTAREWLEEASGGEENIEAMADPLWLHAAVHAATPEGGEALDLALSQDPVRHYLRPAARSFLEARRSCPAAALAHVGLGGVDYLIDRGEPGSAHAERAMRLSGLAGQVAARAGRIASQVGDLDLAARCWRRAFKVGLAEAEWVEAARSSAAALPAETILDRVLERSGEDTLRFACRVFAEPEDTVVRERFLRAALRRLPRDLGPESVKIWHEGQALAWLDDREQARERMRLAVESEPFRGQWREELVDWLIAWGDVEEAHRQAVVGSALQPQRPASCSTLKKAVAAMALKTTTSGGRKRMSKDD